MWYTLKDFHLVVQDIAQKEDYCWTHTIEYLRNVFDSSIRKQKVNFVNTSDDMALILAKHKLLPFTY
jgi:hypothetical protein